MVGGEIMRLNKVMITGGSGYIGRNLYRFLVDAGYDVYCILRASSDDRRIGALQNHIYKYQTYDDIYGVFENVRPDCVIHLATLYDAEAKREQLSQMIESNVVYSTIILDAAVQTGCKYLINTTTQQEYYLGDDFFPVNLYACSKKAFKDMIEYYVKWKSLKCVSLILFETYGPGDERRKILNVFRDARDGDVIQMSPGEQRMYLCHINDVCNAYINVLTNISNLTGEKMEIVEYAVKNDNGLTLKEIASIYQKVSGKEINYAWGTLPYKEGVIMDPGSIGVNLPEWKANISLEEGLRSI